MLGHISRSSGIAKTILQGTEKVVEEEAEKKIGGGDNIKEWTEMDNASSARATENRTRQTGTVAKLFVHVEVPQ